MLFTLEIGSIAEWYYILTFLLMASCNVAMSSFHSHQGSPALKSEFVERRQWVGPSLHGFDEPVHGHH